MLKIEEENAMLSLWEERGRREKKRRRRSRRRRNHCPPLLTPGQGSITIFNMWFLILQATSLVRIWSKIILFWSDFGEKSIFRVF